MGINLTFVCPKHKLAHTPLRGKEGAAFQALIRVHPACFKDGTIRAYHDGYFYEPDWEDFFPGFHAAAGNELSDEELYQNYVDRAERNRDRI